MTDQPTQPAAPRTESGRALHDDRHSADCHDCGLLDRIRAIEDEATAAAVAEVLDDIERNPATYHDVGSIIARLHIASERARHGR